MSVAVFNTWDYGPFCVQPAHSITEPCVRHPDAATDIQIKPAEEALVHSGNQRAISKRRINGGDEERGNGAGGGTKQEDIETNALKAKTREKCLMWQKWGRGRFGGGLP